MLVTTNDNSSSNSLSENMSIQSLHNSLNERIMERNEDFSRAQIISPIGPARSVIRNEENRNECNIFHSLSSMMPSFITETDLQKDKTLHFCIDSVDVMNTASQVDVMNIAPQETENIDSSLARDDLSVCTTVSRDMASHNNSQLHYQPLNAPPLLKVNTSLSIEKQRISVVDDLISNSLSESTAFMEKMTQQLKENQKTLEELGVLSPKSVPNPEPEVDDVSMCSNHEHIIVPQRPSMNSTHKIIVRRASGKETFPMKFHRILKDLENIHGGSDIATFLPDGKSFIIKDIKKFKETVLKLYFPRMKNFSSFHRQLNMYDFRREEKTKSKGTYSHPLFCQDRPELAVFMKSIRGKKSPTTAETVVIDSHPIQGGGGKSNNIIAIG